MRLAILLLTALLAACGTPQPPLVATAVEITQPIPGRSTSAAYLVFTNNTDSEIRITGVSSPQFGSVELHETTVTDGIARMRALAELPIPAHASVTLERGGKHLMLQQPREPVDAVTLQFVSGDAPVLTVNYTFSKDKSR